MEVSRCTQKLRPLINQRRLVSPTLVFKRHYSKSRYLRDNSGHSNVRTTVCFAVHDTPGALEEALRFFRYNKINMTRISSQWSKTDNAVNFFVDMHTEQNHPRVRALLRDLRENCRHADLLGSQPVAWFPMTDEDVDSMGNEVLEGGDDLQADHPGFHDQEYLKRRGAIAEAAFAFKLGEEPALIDYTENEVECWGLIWDRLLPLIDEHACDEFKEAFQLMQQRAGYSRSTIPQMRDINNLLSETTGFRLRPVAGLLSSRNFLNGLAFKIFFCTQYLRHHSVPFYTPEPDLVHELIGHAPMFANEEFAKFSQEIGLASIGATDDQIVQLARCYWFSVEFGLCLGKDGKRKAYGAGVLSSFGEMEHSQSDVPECRDWEPQNAAEQDFPITTFQPIYYVASSFLDARHKMHAFAESLNKPFSVRWNDAELKIDVDRNVERETDAQKAVGTEGGMGA